MYYIYIYMYMYMHTCCNNNNIMVVRVAATLTDMLEYSSLVTALTVDPFSTFATLPPPGQQGEEK